MAYKLSLNGKMNLFRIREVKELREPTILATKMFGINAQDCSARWVDRNVAEFFQKLGSDIVGVYLHYRLARF